MPRLPVIANQSADWCGNPPVEWSQVTITTKNRGNSQFYWYFSVHFPSNRGIATTSVRTGLAMTGNWESARQTPIQVIGFPQQPGKLLFSAQPQATENPVILSEAQRSRRILALNLPESETKYVDPSTRCARSG